MNNNNNAFAAVAVETGQNQVHNPPPPRRDTDPLNLAPHSVESEEAVLGSILMNPEAFYTVRAIPLTSNDFFITRHGWIFDAIGTLADRDEPLDTRTIAEVLRNRKFLDINQLDGAGGEAYLNYLPGTMPTALHAEMYGRLVKRAALRRQLLGAAGEIAQLAYDQDRDIYEVMDLSQAKIFEVHRPDTGTISSFADALKEAWDDIEKMRSGDLLPFVINTPWPGVNKIIWGFKPGTHVIASRLGDGKSSVLLQIILHAVKNKVPAHLLSLEMPTRDIISRIIVQEVDGLELGKLASMNDRQWAQLVDWFGKSVVDFRDLTFDDSTSQTPSQIASRVRDMRRRGWHGVLGIDYVGLMDSDRRYGKRSEELTEITRSLHNLSMATDTCIFYAAQINREGGSGIPSARNLADSDSIGRDATTVILIHNPDNGTQQRNFIVAKQRNGPSSSGLGIVPMVFLGARVSFKDMAKDFQIENQPRPRLKRGRQEDGLGDYDHVYGGR